MRTDEAREDVAPRRNPKVQPSRQRPVGGSSSQRRLAGKDNAKSSDNKARPSSRDSAPTKAKAPETDTSRHVASPSAAEKDSPREEAIASRIPVRTPRVEVEEGEADWQDDADESPCDHYVDDACDASSNGNHDDDACDASANETTRHTVAKDGSSLPTYSAKEVQDSQWIMLSGLPGAVSWAKVRSLLDGVGYSAIDGKVKQRKGVAVVKLESISEAQKAEKKLQGTIFRDMPEADINTRRVPESAKEYLDE